MSNPSVLPLTEWGTLASAFDTTQLGLGKLTIAKNCILRPYGAVKPPPRYDRLWATGIAQTIQATMRALPFDGYPGGVGANGTARAANKCIAVRIYRQGKNFLFFYDLINDKARGLFYMGDDGTYTSGSYDFTAGTPSYEVLAVGLSATSYWYGKRMASMLQLSNNVDTPVCVQLNRTAVPGKWREAGSNAKPAAATISKVPPGTSTNVQAFTVFPGVAAIAMVTFPSSDTIGFYDASSPVTSVSPSTDRITISGFTPVENDTIIFAGGVQPAGTVQYTPYSVRNVSGYSFQLYVGDTRQNITSGSVTTTVLRVYNPSLQVDDAVTVATSGTLPTGLTAGGYYIESVTDWQVTLTDSPGNPAITWTGASSPVTAHTITPNARPARTGGVDLTFTADVDTFPGESGNGKIKVAIQWNSYTNSISSTRIGSGTITDPYIYTVNTGNSAASSSNNAIVSYVNSDTLAIGVLTASTASSNATADTNSWEAQTLGNGSGTGNSDGLTNQTVTVYLRYFDEGNARLGYEGISSDVSNTIILTSSENSDILVSITPDPLAEGGRFGFIRVYFQFGEGALAIWNLVGTVANTSGVKTLRVGTNTVIGQAMSVDQNQLLPFKDVVMVRNQVWHGGSLATPERLYVSKQATDDEIAPEGASVLDPFQIVLPEQVSDLRVTALDTDDFRVHIHTNQGVVLLNPLNPTEDRHIPQVPVGALNPDCLVKWEKSQIYYLGSDLTVYQFDGNRYGKRNASAATKDATQYILGVANLDQVAREPDRVTAWLDTRAELLYYHFPATDGTLNGFCYDFRASGVVGELTYPKVAGMAEMEPERPERVWCDESGNLFVINSLYQEDWGDALSASPAFTPHSTATAMPAQYNGWGYVDYQGRRYYQALETILETGFVNLSDPTKAKAWCGFEWWVVKNSRGFVEVTFTNLNGDIVQRVYGDMHVFGKNKPNKVALNMSGSDVKIKMRIISAEQAPWIIRSAALLYRPAGMY